MPARSFERRRAQACHLSADVPEPSIGRASSFNLLMRTVSDETQNTRGAFRAPFAVADAPKQVGRIGSSAVTQTIQALEERLGADGAAEFLTRHDLARLRETAPGETVDEASFRDLIRALLDEFGPTLTGSLSRRAGKLTADILLANWLRGPIRPVIRALKGRVGPSLGPRLALVQLEKHAAAIAGSGEFRYDLQPFTRIVIGNAFLREDAAVAAVVCQYDQGIVERFFRVLVSDEAMLREDRCQARGESTCAYRIVW